MNRYATDPKILNRYYGTAQAAHRIYLAIKNQTISQKKYISKEGDRLDTLAGQNYKNSSYWWIIAAASGIGWGLQVPPGTVLTIPTKLEEINVLIGG